MKEMTDIIINFCKFENEYYFHGTVPYQHTTYYSVIIGILYRYII